MFKRFVLVTGLVTAVAAGSAAVQTTHAARGHAAMAGIQIMSPTGPVTVGMNGKIPVHVKIKGLMLDPKGIGKSPMAGHGHFHYYVDCIPGDAYKVADIKTCYAAAAASAMTPFDLSKSAVKITKGTHVLLVALANNNHVLYKAPAAAIVFTVR